MKQSLDGKGEEMEQQLEGVQQSLSDSDCSGHARPLAEGAEL